MASDRWAVLGPGVQGVGVRVRCVGFGGFWVREFEVKRLWGFGTR